MRSRGWPASLANAPAWRAGSRRPSPSEDGEALQSVIRRQPDLDDALPDVLERIRTAAERVPGNMVQSASPAVSQADLDRGNAESGLICSVDDAIHRLYATVVTPLDRPAVRRKSPAEPVRL
ncbi:hypothetical protein GCM10023097_61380 [Streptomyces collinus]|uniref:Uncharacterized protein n=1 Tax=Streptomyces collinus TaxID=42684 RepID=A0AA89QAL3_STRCU|nr:hypothetical protein [Streptomyces collinus]